MPSVITKLAEMAFVQRAGGAQAGHAADEEFVQQRAADEHDRAGAERADERPDIGAEECQHAAAGDQIEAGEHAQHQQLALGEIDDLHDAEDQPEADAHQAVDAADGDARGERVQHVLDENFEDPPAFVRLPLSSWPGLTWPSTPGRGCVDGRVKPGHDVRHS